VIESKHKHYGGRVGEMHPLLCVPRGQGDGIERQPIQTVKGGNMSFRRELLERVGGFDERFGQPSLYEETDVSLKVRRLGYKLFFLPEAEIIHLSAPVGGQRFATDPAQFRFIAYRDRVLLFRNNYPLWRFPIFISANLLSALLPILGMEWRSVELALRGLLEGLQENLK
jgi:GT2 family glycosyltransferase